MDDVCHPTRVPYAMQGEAVRAGLAGRAVPHRVTDSMLLADDLRDRAIAAYARLATSTATATDVVDVTLAIMSWDGMEHIMRQQRGAMCSTYEMLLPHAEWVCDHVIPRNAQYDVPLVSEALHSYVRVHATCERQCYHIVWTMTSTDICYAVGLAPSPIDLLCCMHGGSVAPCDSRGGSTPVCASNLGCIDGLLPHAPG